MKRDEHVNTERQWKFEERARKPTFPVRFGSFTCSQTGHVGSMFDEDCNRTNEEPQVRGCSGHRTKPKAFGLG